MIRTAVSAELTSWASGSGDDDRELCHDFTLSSSSSLVTIQNEDGEDEREDGEDDRKDGDGEDDREDGDGEDDRKDSDGDGDGEYDRKDGNGDGDGDREDGDDDREELHDVILLLEIEQIL